MPERFVPIDIAPAKIKIEIKLAINAYSMTVAPPVWRTNDLRMLISTSRMWLPDCHFMRVARLPFCPDIGKPALVNRSVKIVPVLGKCVPLVVMAAISSTTSDRKRPTGAKIDRGPRLLRTRET
jgi:hypothetical protein